MNRAISLLLLSLAGPAAAQDGRTPIPAWFAELGGGAIDSGQDTGRLAEIRLGGNFSPTWSFEAELVRDESDLEGGQELEQTSFALNLVQYNRMPLWNPYFLVGLGARRFEAPGDSDTRPLLQVGVGGQWDLANNGTRLRVEARYRYAPLDSVVPGAVERGEPLLLIGVVFPLGPDL